MKSPGIFCLEGFWFGDHRDRTSVKPIFDLVSQYGKLNYIHHKCSTIEEFTYSIRRWKVKSFCRKYPILYLGFHGDKGSIKVGNTNFSLLELQTLLGESCEGTIIHFGSCSTLDLSNRELQKFMNATKTLAIMGYEQDVDWIKSTSFEILILEHLYNTKFDSQGIKSFASIIKNDCKRQVKEFDFKIVANESWNFARKRKKVKPQN